MTDNQDTLSEVIQCKDFNPTMETVTFKKRKDLKNGSIKIPLDYNGKQLWMFSNRHKNPFGLSRGNHERYPETYGKKLNCSLSLDRRTAKGKAFYDAMVNFEDVICQAAYDNRVEWGLCKAVDAADTTKRDIRKLFNRIIRVACDDKGNPIEAYDPTFRVDFRVTKDDSGMVNGVLTEVWDEKGQKVDVVDESTVPPMSDARVIMGCQHVYVIPATGKFGVAFKLHQLRVYPGSRLPTGRCLIQDAENDSSDDEGADKTPEKPLATSKSSVAVADNDSDEPTPSRPRLSLGTRK